MRVIAASVAPATDAPGAGGGSISRGRINPTGAESTAYALVRRKGEVLRVVLCLTCERRKINEDEEDEEEGDGGEREEGNHWVPPSYRHPLAQGKELIRLIHAQPREAGPPLCFWVIFETRYTPVPPAKYLSCFSTWNHPWKEENHDFFKIFTLCPLNYYEFS
uniref:Uncharacterized protein n=1 Tax=Vespula pensylvanica TaxID=30213 RepID=A0A834N646_VESPE|nr:hypothetical protein H0235_016228 [Vespula pensylvanica]